MTPFREKLCALDAFLTGRLATEVAHNARNQKGDLFDMVSRTYYLSDGGYSRVGLVLNDDDTVTAFLDSLSTDRAKAAWCIAGRQIRELEEAATAELRS